MQNNAMQCSINGPTYLEILSQFVPQYLFTLKHDNRSRASFQQGGASVDFTNSVRLWSDEQFPGLQIGRDQQDLIILAGSRID